MNTRVENNARRRTTVGKTDGRKNPWTGCVALLSAAVALSGVGALQGAGSQGDCTPQIDRAAALSKFQRPSKIVFPKENPHSKQKEDLGRTLFFDPRLSAAGTTSCASCHNPGFIWGDGLPHAVGFGAKELGRRTPTILNVAWGEQYFWDGRASSLEEQALGPIAAAGEMNLPIEKLLERLRGIPGYSPLFEQAFPGQGIQAETIAKAIATFERTVVSGQAPFDEWVSGREDAIQESAKKGFDLFVSKALCNQCHAGWNFTDDGFHDIGVPGNDPGRGKVLPDIPAVRNAFKTPTLRNVAQRHPYLHDGSEKSLESVMHFYNSGGKAKRESLDINVKPLGLTEAEIKNLCDFLLTLSSQDVPALVPTLPN